MGDIIEMFSSNKKKPGTESDKAECPLKLLVIVNGEIIEKWGEDSFPTHARIYHLVNEIRKFDGINICYVSYQQLPRSGLLKIIYNNIIKTFVLIKYLFIVIRYSPHVYFEYPYSMTTAQNRILFKSCTLLKLKTILDVHDTVEQAEAIGNGRSVITKETEKYCLEKATLISSLNPSMWDRITERYNLPKGKRVVFVPNAFEESFLQEFKDAYRSIKGRFNICYIGGLSKNRGIDILTQSCTELHKKYPNIRLYLFGEYGKEISEDVKRIIESSDFILRRVVPRKMLAEQLRDIDLFVMPYNPGVDYLNFSSPTKFFEYIGTGKPIVSSKCKSLLDIGKGGAIIYFDYNESDLKSKIEMLIASPEMRDSISKKTMYLRADHTWKKRAEVLYDAIRSI
jgi:glycosyltransferase involved in cell wall biosynthesis